MSAKNLSEKEAKALAREALRKTLGPRLDEFEIKTEPQPFGWVFRWRPKSGEPFGGNAPIIVDRENGSVHWTGTGRPLEIYLEAYARYGSTKFADGRWEDAVHAQESRQLRAHTDARRDGRADWDSKPEVVIDWDEVTHVLAHGPVKEAPVRAPQRCCYCDAYLPPSKAVNMPAGLACSRCASKP